MSHPIVVGSSSLSNSVLTVTFRVAADGPAAVNDFQLEFAFTAASVTNVTGTGPDANFLVSYDAGAGTVSAGWFGLSNLAPGATVASLSFTLANAGATSFATNFSGEAASVQIPSMPLVLADNAFNSPASGSPSVSGTPVENQTLTASASGISDFDHLGTFNFQWLRNGVAIDGATASNYQLDDADVGQNVQARVRYTDGAGNLESLTSAASSPIGNVNDIPTGGVTVQGPNPTVFSKGMTLSANTAALVDNDGLGAFSYEWRNNSNALLATTPTYTLQQSDVNSTIAVTIKYTDAHGTAEMVTSPSTTTIQDNAPPTAVADAITNAVEDTPILITAAQLLGNDSDVETANGALTIGTVTSGTGGTAIRNPNGTVSFTPTPNFNGTASFSYTVNDGQVDSAPATVSVTVAAVNDPPTANPDTTLTATEDIAKTFAAADLLGNDTDVDGDTLTLQSVSNAIGGTAVLNANGSVTFTPTLNHNGAASFSYTVRDGSGTTSTTTASITIAPVNDAPVAVNDAGGTTNEDIARTYAAAELLGNDTDVDGNSLTIASVASGSGGTALLNANGSVTFTPTANASGNASFTYVATDGTANSNAATVSLSVVAVNDAPVAHPNTGTTSEDVALTFTAAQLLGNDTDVEGSALTVSGVTSGSNGTVALNANGTVTFTPTANFNGTASFSYTARDGTANSAPATVTVTVNPVNDAPTGAVAIAGTATELQTLTASNTLADVDGVGNIGYQWMADGVNIGGATSSTLQLAQEQVGKAVTVKASYLDGAGTAESRTSAATAKIQNVNQSPTGAVTISGTPTQNQTVSANTSALRDMDGLPTLFSYLWLAGGVAITGATASTFKLTQAEVGKAMTVRVSYTDQQGKAESVTSSATPAVGNENDPLTGNVTIEGARVTGVPLEANTAGLADLDGIGTFAYQWMSGATNISGATGATFTPGATLAGASITVKVTHTDKLGGVESKTSAAITLSKEDDVTPLSGAGLTTTAGDGNGDGLKDSTQAPVVSAPLQVLGKATVSFVTLVADSSTSGGVNAGSTALITSLDQQPVPSNKPGQMNAPLGLIEFKSDVAGIGQTETFSLFVDSTVNVNGYWKVDKTGTWVNLASEPFGGTTTLIGNKIRLNFKITDGGEFDSDGKADGFISDPGAAATMPLSLVGYLPDVTLTGSTHFFF